MDLTGGFSMTTAKEVVIREINRYACLEPTSNAYHHLFTWDIDTLLAYLDHIKITVEKLQNFF